MTRATSRGFTLIELMIVVAVIGVLASIAVPLYLNQVRGAKRAERQLVMRALVPAIENFATAGNAIGTMVGDPHPAGTPGAMAKPWGFPAGGWGELSATIEGAVRYQYSFTVVQDPGMIWYTVKAVGDLDEDGQTSLYIRAGRLVGGEWIRDDVADDTFD